MEQNVTYLIGAGASYNALPIVSNWNERMKQFTNYLENLDLRYFDELKIDIQKIKAEVQQLLSEADKHATVDTFAKKLFLKNAPESNRKLMSLKHFLGCFFSFEQTFLINWDKLRDENGNIVEGISSQFEGQKAQVDPRYDVFFATLLNPETKELNERINIISWNYDLQLEKAYSDFYEKLNPQVKLKMFPNAYGTVLAEGRKFQTIKLNGTAGLVHTKEGYSPVIPNLKGDYFPKRREGKMAILDSHEFDVPTLEAMLTVYSRYLNGDESIEPSMSFAWEENHTTVDN